MIFFFKRMTLGLTYQRLVNYIGFCCIFAYIAVILTVRYLELCSRMLLIILQITFSCWPVRLNFQYDSSALLGVSIQS